MIDFASLFTIPAFVGQATLFTPFAFSICSMLHSALFSSPTPLKVIVPLVLLLDDLVVSVGIEVELCQAGRINIMKRPFSRARVSDSAPLDAQAFGEFGEIDMEGAAPDGGANVAVIKGVETTVDEGCVPPSIARDAAARETAEAVEHKAWAHVFPVRSGGQVQALHFTQNFFPDPEAGGRRRD